jgi:hypothetical protein
MKNDSLPPQIGRLIDQVRSRDLRFRYLNGIVRGVALTLALMLVAMLIDLMVGWLGAGSRWTATFITLGLAALGYGVWLVLPVLHRPNRIQVSQMIDAKTPHLEERWSTVTEFSNNEDPESIRGSTELIQAVKVEAEELKPLVSPERIISDTPYRLGLKWLAGVTVFVLAFIAYDVSQASVLLKRFWWPATDASLTQIAILNNDAKVPVSEPLLLQAKITGRKHPNATYITLKDPHGNQEQYLMAALDQDASRYEHPIRSVSDSFEFRVRSGDDQTDWLPITAVSRPKITDIQFAVNPPTYSGLPNQSMPSLPHRIRLLSGTQVDLRLKADQSLRELSLQVDGQAPLRLKALSNNWYQFTSTLEESIAFKTVLRNAHDLENKTKPTSHFIVYEDLPPAVRILDPTEDVAKRPDDTVEITFAATDDFGIQAALLTVKTVNENGEEETKEIPIDLGDEAGEPTIEKEIQLDLAQFDLKQGDQVSYSVSVVDTHQGRSATSGPSSPPSPAAPSEANTTMAGQSQSPQNENQDHSESSTTEASPSEESSTSPLMAASSLAEESSQPQATAASSPPPNEMAKRMLDLGQAGSCQPRNIQIDEWAGEFDGDKSEKLQLAIAPVLQRLNEALKAALTRTEEAQKSHLSSGTLGDPEADQIARAREHLRHGQSAVAELTAKSAGTPYAFMGLQLQNIDASHITPAHEKLLSIGESSETTITDDLNTGKFHIERAIAMLEELEKTYEQVKRDQKIGDAMQRLAKMHQIFLENSQRLLGNKKPALNSYDRKIAEVDEEFVEQLKELLEEKKKIMEELSRLLAEDPRLLRRYLAMMQLQSTSHRDQMTLLAQRQSELKAQVAAWTKATPSEKTTLIDSFTAKEISNLGSTIELSAQMHENMETWIPLEISATDPALQALTAEAQQLIEALGRSAAELAAGNRQNGMETATSALVILRSLHEQLPQLPESFPDEPQMATYTANRLEEVEHLISVHSGWLKVLTLLDEENFAGAAEVIQHRLEQDTTTLAGKIEATKDQVASMSDEIRETAEALVTIVNTDILYPQSVATEQLRDAEWEDAVEMETHLVTAFSLAELRFDELLNLIIAKMDEAPAPSAPGSNKSLDDLLAMLENEMKAQETLGIPCRPLNVSLMRDWMSPSSGSSSGSAQSQARAAQAQASQAQQQADQLQKAANAAAKALAAKSTREAQGKQARDANGPEAPKKSWNVLASQLEKDILQSRDNVPPEKYRQAINAYFQTIAENVPASR